MTVGTVRRAGRGHNTAVVRCRGMQCTPVGAVTGGAVAAGGEVLANRRASQAAVGIVAAGAAVMGVAGSTPQGVVMAVCTGSRCHLHQGAVIRGVGSMGGLPCSSVALIAIATAGRNARLQVRDIGMAKTAIAAMGYSNREI